MNPKFVKWTLLLSGVLTLTMVYAAFQPQAAVRSSFGTALDGPVADIIVRNWRALIALVGAMLIYAAYEPAVRPLVLTVAGISKLIFISLVLSHGQTFLAFQAGVAVAVDSLMVLFYVAYLATSRRKAVPTQA
jgi:hypothetical protein